jgi:superfamily II DNA or RNA helicase
MELRPYQRQARDAIFREWETGRQRTLLVLPTGAGKTIVFCSVSEEVVRRGGRVLILAHRGELLDQAADKMRRSTGLACALEKADSTCLGEWERITVGSVQSLMRPARLAKFQQDYFRSIIVDEAHHCLADTYQRVLSHFSQASVLGVTATPDRGDKRNLGQYFDSLAFEYTLPQAVKDGYLCRIVAATIPLQLDISGVKQQNGDYQLAGVATALDPYLEQIADELVKYRQRKTVVFLPLIATAKKFAHMLRQRGIEATEVNGESFDRTEILQRFEAVKDGVLCNAMLLTEGWDCSSVDCIVVLRPTRIRSLYCQMIGRGTRIHSGKDNLLILDFLWHTTNHELCRPADLVCESPETAAKMTQMLADEAGEEMDIGDMEEAAESCVIEEREEALAAKLRELRNKKSKLVDPLQYEMSIGDEDLADYQPSFGWEMSPASEGQLDALEKYGLFAGEVGNAGKASLLLDRLQKRRSAGLASPKQIRLLERKGFQHVGQWSFDAASKMIARISASGWRVPSGVSPATYRPETAPADVSGEFGFSYVEEAS